MISARPVTAAMGMPPPSDFAIVMRSGSMPKCSEANHLPVRAKPGLHFVGDEEDAVLAADGVQRLEVVARRNDEAAFAEHRLGDHGGDGFGGDVAFECVFEMMRESFGGCFAVGAIFVSVTECDRRRWRTARIQPYKDALCW